MQIKVEVVESSNQIGSGSRRNDCATDITLTLIRAIVPWNHAGRALVDSLFHFIIWTNIGSMYLSSSAYQYDPSVTFLGSAATALFQ